MRNKTLCVLGLWLALLAVLSGCGSPSGNGSDAPSASAEHPEAISTHEPTPTLRSTESPTESSSPFLEEPTTAPAEESAQPGIDDTINEGISTYSGVYEMYDQPPFNAYDYPSTIAIDENGRVNGLILSGKTPIYVTQNDNGTLTCVISEGEQKFDEVANMLVTTQPKEFYVVCPAGVTSGFDDYPDYDYLGVNTDRIRYLVIGGGVIDIMYYKIS